MLNLLLVGAMFASLGGQPKNNANSSKPSDTGEITVWGKGGATVGPGGTITLCPKADDGACAVITTNTETGGTCLPYNVKSFEDNLNFNAVIDGGLYNGIPGSDVHITKTDR